MFVFLNMFIPSLLITSFHVITPIHSIAAAAVVANSDRTSDPADNSLELIHNSTELLML